METEPTPAPQSNGKTKVRYYNLGGMESNTPFDGLNIEVTTDSENGSSAKKYIRVH